MDQQQNPQCKCPYSCNRHGNCQACIEYHSKSGSATNCGKTSADKVKK